MTRLFVIKYAERDKSFRAEHFYRGDPCGDHPMPIHYFTWYIESSTGARIVVDTGFTEQTASQRGDRTFLGAPPDTLAAMGVPVESVTHVVLSHLHYDHTGYVSAYPNARVIVQRRELDFWTGPFATRGEHAHIIAPADIEWVAQQARAGGRVDLVDGDVDLADDVRLVLTGGHTAGLQMVQVQMSGRSVVLTSDASHFYENVMDDRPYSIVDHLPSMYAAFDLIHELADSPELIVPGHDPKVWDRLNPVEGSDLVRELIVREQQGVDL